MLYDAIIMSVIVISVVDDMFFASKIRAVAEAAGVEISFPRSQEAVVSKARETKPGLIVVDLHNQKIDPVALARELKADEKLQSITLLGFFSHVQTELQRNALAAGFDRVIPRSMFARDLPQILTADYTDTGAITS
jgi:CheY-like chemotaxis protein